MAGAPGDTIVALSSGSLPAAIAVVRTSGPHALAAAHAIAGSLGDDRRATLRSLRDPADGALIDRALIIRFDGPDSATGEDIVEYHCHGSRAVVAALIEALTARDGLRAAEPGEFTRRALSNGRIDLTQAEGLAELLAAESEAQRKSALRRADGALRDQIAKWRDTVLALSAEAEVAIDYADEEDGAAAYEAGARASALVTEIDALLSAPRVERLRDGTRVVVAGPPNAGKSSLVNALAGEQRAIVTPIAGTTRDLIEVPLAIDGLPFTLVDTAGLRASDDAVEAIGIGLAEREIDRADLILWLGHEPLQDADAPVLQIAAKADIITPGAGLAVSAHTGLGLAALKAWLVGQAQAAVPSDLGINEREAALLIACRNDLAACQTVPDPVLAAEHLRSARSALDRISGTTGIEHLLDALFGRFCLGK